MKTKINMFIRFIYVKRSFVINKAQYLQITNSIQHVTSIHISKTVQFKLVMYILSCF